MRYIASIAVASFLALCMVAWAGSHGQGQGQHSSKGGTKRSSGVPPTKGAGKKSTGQQDKSKGQKQPPVSNPKNPGNFVKHPGLNHKYHKSLKGIGQNPNVGGGVKGAIDNLLSGNFLSVDQRQELNNLVAGNPAKLGDDDLKAVQAALDYDALAKREQRFLRIENATGARLTIWLHYQTLAEKDVFDWFPVKPVDQEKALRYVLEANADLYLTDGSTRIAAARARVWAESDSGQKWLSYRDRDLKMKPTERTEIQEMGTYPLRLVGNAGTAEQARK